MTMLQGILLSCLRTRFPANEGSCCIASAKLVTGPRANTLISPGCSLTRSIRKSAADLPSFSPYRCQHEIHALESNRTVGRASVLCTDAPEPPQTMHMLLLR